MARAMIDLAGHGWMRDLLGDSEIANVLSAEADLTRYLQVEAAWTRALGQVEDAEPAADVAAAIEALRVTPDDLRDGFTRDGVVVPALVAAIKAAVPSEDAVWVHRGLTSQDVVDTGLMLALRDVFGVLGGRLAALEERLAGLDARFGAARVMAFTRMQPALETTGARMLDAWRHPLGDVAEACGAVEKTLGVIQWGGPIGARDHAQAEALGAAFAAELGLRDPGRAWHTDRARIADAAHMLGRMATITGKIGEDIALMAAVGPAQISLRGGGSSAMPHKNNPVKAEALIALSDLVGTLQAGLIRSGRHEGFRSGRAWTLEWLILPQLCVAAGAGLSLADDLLSDVVSLGEIAG